MCFEYLVGVSCQPLLGVLILLYLTPVTLKMLDKQNESAQSCRKHSGLIFVPQRCEDKIDLTS